MPKPKAILTKDERLIVGIHEAALAKGSNTAPVEILPIAIGIGLQKRGADTIAKLLFRSNFIKKTEEGKVYLTPHGIKLVESLLEG